MRPLPQLDPYDKSPLLDREQGAFGYSTSRIRRGTALSSCGSMMRFHTRAVWFTDQL